MNMKQKVVAGAVAGLAVAGGGAAIAATQIGSPRDESQAIVNDAAHQLGVQPQALSDALKKAIENRIDAAVAAGRLTKEEGAALKQRVESGELPFLAGPPGPHFGPGPFGHHLDAAASHLGLTAAQLRSKLMDGTSLAQVAGDQGKSVDGLVQALVDEARTHLDSAVRAGHLTKAQETSMLAGLKERITDLVNGRFPPILPHRFGMDRGPRGAWN